MMKRKMANERIKDVKRDNDGVERNGANKTQKMLTVEPQMTSGYQYEQLLPGMLDEISLDIIVPKLSWRECDILSKVSPGWQKAMRGREIYDTRVRAHSLETLAVVEHTIRRSQRCGVDQVNISLYSMRDECWYELPPIAGFPARFPKYCECVSLDGKIYILGGSLQGSGNKSVASAPENEGTTVYMFDLVGQRRWQQCASMRDGRLSRSGHSAGVIDGKIYVFGNFSVNLKFINHLNSEVYNPQIDAWSDIKPMKSPWPRHQVARVGDECLVYSAGESFVDPHRRVGSRVLQRSQWRSQWLLEAYHPIKDEWRLIERFERHKSEIAFTAQGKIHLMTERGIYGHDDQHLRTLLHSYSFSEFVPAQTVRIKPCQAVHMDGEVLVLLLWQKESTRIPHTLGRCLLRSRGFGQKDREIAWETIKCRHCHEKCFGTFDTSCWLDTTLKGSVQL